MGGKEGERGARRSRDRQQRETHPETERKTERQANRREQGGGWGGLAAAATVGGGERMGNPRIVGTDKTVNDIWCPAILMSLLYLTLLGHSVD